MKTKKIKCENCCNDFEKLLKEFNRSEKLGRKHFCSRTCSAIYTNKNKSAEYWKEKYEKQRKSFDIKSLSGNQRDEYSPFRIFLNTGRASIKRHQVYIDEKYLKELWEKQQGICPYTGIKMILPQTTNLSLKCKSLEKASLDRIDSTKQYTKDNVEFVCMAINLAKNNHTKKEMMSFIENIISSVNNLSITQEQPT